MRRRTDERRRRERRILWVSLGVAAVLHACALVFIRWDRAGPEWSPDRSTVELESQSWTGTRIAVLFGPPKTLRPSGEFVVEPGRRVLETVRLLRVPPICLRRAIPPSAPGQGEIRLTVNAEGRIDAAALSRTTGDACWDQVATRVAGDLWYRWLPGRHAAPLEVLQPITVGLGLD